MNNQEIVETRVFPIIKTGDLEQEKKNLLAAKLVLENRIADIDEMIERLDMEIKRMEKGA